MSKIEKHLKQNHGKEYDEFLNKKDDKKKKREERKQRKDKRRQEKVEKKSEAGKRRREEAETKKVLFEDCKKALNMSAGTSKMIWQYFHQLPNSEMIKCLKCHR